MLDARTGAGTSAGAGADGPAGGGRPWSPGLRDEAGCALGTRSRRRSEATAGAQTAERSGSAAGRSAGLARGEPAGREQRQQGEAEG